MKHLTSSTSSMSSSYSTLSLPLMSLRALFPSCSVHTPGSHLPLPPPRFPPSLPLSPPQLHPTPSLQFLISSPLVSLYSCLLCISIISVLLLLSLSLSSPSLPLSVRLSWRPFLSRSPTVGKQLIIGGRGGWPCGEGSGSVSKVTLSAEKGGGGDWGKESGKMGAGAQSWGNCMPTVAAGRLYQHGTTGSTNAGASFFKTSSSLNNSFSPGFHGPDPTNHRWGKWRKNPKPFLCFV